MENNQEHFSAGKFKSADELLAAYNALEREFTKRCQLLKKLQNESGGGTPEAQENSVNGETSAQSESELKSPDCGGCATDGTPSDTADAPTEAQLAPTETGVAPTEVETITRIAAPLDPVAEIAKNAEAYAEALADLPQVMACCIARYKACRSGHAVIPAPSGAAVIAPVKRPLTLADAKRLADEMLK